MMPSVQLPDKEDIEGYFDRLYPLLRSITGEGLRETHKILSEIVPLEHFETPSGTKVFDWTVPKEWRVHDAYVVTPDGNRILDVQTNNLHLINYSSPFRGKVSKQVLDEHLYSLPDLPDAVPYIISYYKERWGFCISHTDRLLLPEGDYEIVIDTDFIDGSLTYSEAVLPGKSDQEILISAYTCHPSMANHELSGPLVTAFLYQCLASMKDRQLTYRFVFCPESVGVISYLAERGDLLREKTISAFVLNNIGLPRSFVYMRSSQGDSLGDRAVGCLAQKPEYPGVEFIDFYADGGSNWRHFSSPGFQIPTGCLMRCLLNGYPEYHTSLDNKNMISFAAIRESIKYMYHVCYVMENNRKFTNLFPFGEPQLGKRELYNNNIGGKYFDPSRQHSAIMWLLNLSDGDHDLIDVSTRANLDIDTVIDAAERLVDAGLIMPS